MSIPLVIKLPDFGIAAEVLDSHLKRGLAKCNIKNSLPKKI